MLTLLPSVFVNVSCEYFSVLTVRERANISYTFKWLASFTQSQQRTVS